MEVLRGLRLTTREEGLIVEMVSDRLTKPRLINWTNPNQSSKHFTLIVFLVRISNFTPKIGNPIPDSTFSFFFFTPQIYSVGVFFMSLVTTCL